MPYIGQVNTDQDNEDLSITMDNMPKNESISDVSPFEVKNIVKFNIDKIDTKKS
jgi:hypothetical protein